MDPSQEAHSRRWLLKALGTATGGLALERFLGLRGVAAQATAQQAPAFTGPGVNPYWNSVGPIVTEPQKAPLILLTDRPAGAARNAATLFRDDVHAE